MRRRVTGLVAGAVLLAASAVPAFAGPGQSGKGPVTGADNASPAAIAAVCAAISHAIVSNPNDPNANQLAVLGVLLDKCGPN